VNGTDVSPGLQTVDRALDILCAFSEKDEIGISELSRRLKLPKSAVHRVMHTLALRGFIEQGENRRYRLGLRVLELGNVCRLRMELPSVGALIVKELSVQANCNSHLAKMDGMEVVDLVRSEYPAPVRVARMPILRRPVHCTALGKAMLAFGDAAHVDVVIRAGLSRLTHRTITQPARFRGELSRIRERGFAIDNEEFYAGTRCVAAPVFDELGQVIAGLSLSALITHITEDRVEHFGSLVIEAARRISVRLGYRSR
jgi:IclR family transcriptional regulator, KDG regulon repressor